MLSIAEEHLTGQNPKARMVMYGQELNAEFYAICKADILVTRQVKREEPLLAFKRRALVHFAVSTDEVWMATELKGKNTFFLPFNLGSNGGAGTVTGGVATKIGSVKVPGISSGRGNMTAVEQAVKTRIANGNASKMSVATAVKGAIGGQVANAGKTTAGAAVDAAKAKTCQSTGGCE